MKSELQSEFSQYRTFSTEWKRFSLGQNVTHEAAEQFGSSHRGSILELHTWADKECLRDAGGNWGRCQGVIV